MESGRLARGWHKADISAFGLASPHKKREACASCRVEKGDTGGCRTSLPVRSTAPIANEAAGETAASLFCTQRFRKGAADSRRYCGVRMTSQAKRQRDERDAEQDRVRGNGPDQSDCAGSGRDQNHNTE